MKQAHHHHAGRFARGLRLAAPAASRALALLAASAQARFGYEPSDPVRTEDVAGEYSFAARLRDANGAPVSALRTASSFSFSTNPGTATDPHSKRKRQLEYKSFNRIFIFNRLSLNHRRHEFSFDFPAKFMLAIHFRLC